MKFMGGRLSLFEQDFIKDADCTKDTPVIYGKEDAPIYGTGIKLKPRIPWREDSEHMKKIYLKELFPLEEYDFIAALLSGGKDSIACYYKLLELGAPKEKIEFWHHDIDGGHPLRRMDWRCTKEYVKAFSEAEGVPRSRRRPMLKRRQYGKSTFLRPTQYQKRNKSGGGRRF